MVRGQGPSSTHFWIVVIVIDDFGKFDAHALNYYLFFTVYL